MSADMFDEDARLHASGDLSRRKFMNRLVAGGMTAAAAFAFMSASGASSASAAPGGGSSGAFYGTPPGMDRPDRPDRPGQAARHRPGARTAVR